MKRIFKQILALTLLAVMLFSCTVFARADGVVSTHTVVTGVTYTKYSVSSTSVHDLSFNPTTGDYILMPFAGYAGTSGDLATQYSCATGSRYGYTVAGIINGDFFGMGSPYGTLTGINVSNGKLESAHIPTTDSCIAFNSDGTFTPVNINLSSTIEIGGESYKDLIWYFNKTRGEDSAANWSTYDKLFYYDISCGTKCDTYFAGTEILCNKVDNTDISIGHTLVGEVVSVTQNTKGGTVGSNQFILYYPNTSSAYTSLVNGVQAGDTIKITVSDSNPASQAIEEKAVGLLTNIGWLVKDGVNRTYIDSEIGTHAVTYKTKWAAYGWEDDGTVHCMVSEGSLTMRDIAQKLIDLGCNNVVRLDGGGSSAMYLSNTGSGSAGYAYNQGRAVGDCVLVLKRSSAAPSSLKTALSNKISSVSAFAEYIPDVLASAQAIYNSSKSISGDYKHAIMALRENGTPHGILEQCLKKAANNNPDGYSDYAADVIEAAYFDAKRIYGAASSSDELLLSTANTLSTLLNDDSLTGTRISLGAKYAAYKVNTASYPDTGNRELTDGTLFNASALDAAWTGFKKTDKLASDTYGDYTEVCVDLGSVKSPDKVSVSACNQTGWGIYAPTRVALYASSNGTDYYLASVLSPMINAVSGEMQEILYTASLTDISARYYIVRAYFGGSHLFLGEISFYKDTPASGSYYVSKGVDKFNAGVTTDSVVVFNKGTLTHANANLTWSTSYVCEKTDGGYKVTQKISPNGDNTYSYTVPSGGFIIAFHGAAYTKLISKRAVQIGDICAVTGFDPATSTPTVYPLARVAFYPASTAIYIRPATTNFGVFTSDAVSEYGLTDGDYIELPHGLSVAAVNNNLFTDPRFTYTPAVSGAANIGTGAVYTTVGGKTYTVCVEGDLNGDGCIKATDYLLLKRIAIGTYTGSTVQRKAAVIDGNTLTRSYALLKRHVLGTYTIQP